MILSSSITVDLAHSKLLKEAGWEQLSSHFCWCILDNMPETLETVEYQKGWLKLFGTKERKKFFDCPTAEEILRRLPEEVVIEKNYLELRITKNDMPLTGSTWIIEYWRTALHDQDFALLGHEEESSSLANAAAAMFVFLSKNKLLKP